ncbi:draxin-A-like isoform X1 [Acipenser ruthenus]|uniref:draxin-A-like isoform X1 n=2 Tax=Acipenser ruthenus TaxID=7906 RepID=UPI0027407487|nr:draxin-A-like isoform X1 [Acipenser ruthenus]
MVVGRQGLSSTPSERMAARPWCPALLLTLLLVGDFALTDSAEPGSRNNKRGSSQQLTGTANYLQSPELWAQQPGHHRRQGGRKDKAREVQQLGRPEDDGPGLEGLTPVRLEQGERESRPSALQDEHHGGEFQGFGLPFHEPDNHPPSAESTLKGRKQHKKHRGKDKARHDKGRLVDPEPGLLFKQVEVFDEPPPSESASPSSPPAPPSFSTSYTTTTTTLVTMATSQEPPAPPPAATRPKKPSQGRVRSDGDVMPTLDMALFDWTDYEDLKPAWPSSRKKDKRRSKNLSSGNETLEGEAEAEPCDHHLDCLPGSCCDLRQHVCKPHNRGLNNKCYDDCMCEEGLRCYAKFHRNRRVTRRRGRCIDPESADNDQGSFMTV